MGQSGSFGLPGNDVLPLQGKCFWGIFSQGVALGCPVVALSARQRVPFPVSWEKIALFAKNRPNPRRSRFIPVKTCHSRHDYGIRNTIGQSPTEIGDAPEATALAAAPAVPGEQQPTGRNAPRVG